MPDETTPQSEPASVPPSPGATPQTTSQPPLSPSLVTPANASETAPPMKKSRLIYDQPSKPGGFIIAGFPPPPPPVKPDVIVDGMERPAKTPDGS